MAETKTATRFICTKDDPYTAEKARAFNGYAIHPDASEVDGADDECAYFKCPNCGVRWKEELGQ